MKLLVIGHSVEDHPDPGNYNLTYPGGIYYSAAALNAMAGAVDEIFLCTAVEQRNYALFAPVYDKLNKLYIEKTNKMPAVRLITTGINERSEIYSHIPNPLSCSINDLKSFDGILINMITGFDLTIEQLENIRNNFEGTIYLDVHTLSRGIKNSETGIIREFRKIPDFNIWASYTDIIQTNQSEVQTISQYEEEQKSVENILKKEGQAIIVTKDKFGAVCYIFESGKVKNISAPGINVAENNKIGCGDIFGAVFFYTYIKNKSISESLKQANAEAAAAVSGYSRLLPGN